MDSNRVVARLSLASLLNKQDAKRKYNSLNRSLTPKYPKLNSTSLLSSQNSTKQSMLALNNDCMQPPSTKWNPKQMYSAKKNTSDDDQDVKAQLFHL